MGLHLCNNYTSLISTAIMFYSPETCGGDGQDFEYMGWWNIQPGACAFVYANDLEDLNRFWYVYAIATDGAEWSGPFVRESVPLSKAFNKCWGFDVNFPFEPPYTSVKFFELDIGDADNFTLTFTP